MGICHKRPRKLAVPPGTATVDIRGDVSYSTIEDVESDADHVLVARAGVQDSIVRRISHRNRCGPQGEGYNRWTLAWNVVAALAAVAAVVVAVIAL
jgi:hypothetical protein